MANEMAKNIIELDKVAFYFQNNPNLLVIENVSFSAAKNQFVSIIGPSGCGKSTLLRNIAGLVEPSAGAVKYLGKRVTNPTKEISFVFQDFALLPWLTNLENIKLGLADTELNEHEKTSRAMALIEKFGLVGFENYYPNAISGGMKQRIGIARAVITNPKVLLMDEPFSALDELTANVLRGDINAMLRDRKISVDSVIMVTHNVPEAVELSDKIVVLSEKPSHVKKEIRVDMDYPRNRHSREFMDAVDNVYSVLAE
jgi:NitT/TauT family transport system ATP-binding protein